MLRQSSSSAAAAPALHRHDRRFALLSSPLARPLARPLRFKEEERERQERKEREEALEAARERRARAEREAKRAIEDAAEAVKKAAQSAVPPATQQKEQQQQPQRLPPIPETALVNSIPFYVPAFTRFKEIKVGRVSMLGMAASAVFEIARPDHPGALAATAQNFGWPLPTVELALGLFVLHGLLGLWPTSPTYSDANTRDYLRRQPGAPAVFVNPLLNPAHFFGVAPFSFGFNKRNELLHCRLAMLAFLGSCAAEIKTGGIGTLGQLAYWLGKAGVDVGIAEGGMMPALPPDLWYSRAGGWLLAWSAFCFLLAYARGSTGEIKGGDDVY